MPVATNGESWCAPIVQAYQQSQPLLFLFDYDGTLTPIVAHPSLAVLTHDRRELLARLIDLPNIFGGVVSGRALHEVRKLIAHERFYLAGSGGLEMDLLGEHVQFPETDLFTELFGNLHDQFQSTLKRYPGAWIERKPAALAIHFRGLLPLAAVCFRSDICGHLACVPEVLYRIVAEAIEVTPATGWDKGTAVEAILKRVKNQGHARPFPIYFGDSGNDKEGMTAVLAAGGIAVGVGPEAPSIASHTTQNPDTLARNLYQVHRSLSTIAGRGSELLPEPEDPEPAGDDSSNLGIVILTPDSGQGIQLSGAMHQLGWKVWPCGSVAQANGLLDDASKNIRVAMIDLQLPGLQGARILAEWSRAYPTVLRCGMADVLPYMATAYRKLSDTPLFSKPIRAEILDQKLREELE